MLLAIRSTAGLLVGASLLLAGCSLRPPSEMRYRYYDPDISPFTGEAAVTPEEITNRFGSTARLNRDLDELGREGFVFDKSDLASYGSDEIELAFERPYGRRKLPTNAPMEFTGLYKLSGNDAAVYYALSPIRWGYQIHAIRGDDYSTSLAWWDGRYLNWQEGSTYYRMSLDSDGLAVTIFVDNVTQDLQRPQNRTVSALRVRPPITVADTP